MATFSVTLFSLILFTLVATVISIESGEDDTERYQDDDMINGKETQIYENENEDENDDKSESEVLNENTEIDKNETVIYNTNQNEAVNSETENNNTETLSSEDETDSIENENDSTKNENDSIKNETDNSMNTTETENETDNGMNTTESEKNETNSNINQRIDDASENNGTYNNKDGLDGMEIGTEFFDEDTEPNDFSFTLDSPNILVIMADDLGWNDVSYRGSNQIMTPNMDTLAYQGVTFQKYYTDAFGTASRSAFFTGKYPSRLGTQSNSIKAFEDRGLSVKEKLLPSYLKDLGYSTHLVGKWGLGKSRKRYLPTNRGFDTFFGFLGNSVDYLTYNHIEQWNNSQFFGLDLFLNMTPVEDRSGHLTEILTDHAVKLIREHDNSGPLYIQLSHAAPHAGGGLVNLQPSDGAIKDNDHIAHSARRLYASLVTDFDKSIGNIVAALAEKDLLHNTLIIIASDNGAAPVGETQNFGSNLPLRGLKGTPWEGGVRSSAILWHADITSDIWDGLFHVTDWVPTIVAAAGGNITESLDGVNQWDAIKNGEASRRKEILITIDDLNNWAAIREGDYKLIVGDMKQELSSYYGTELSAERFEPPSYEDVLLDCEALRIIKDTLGKGLNIHTVFLKRNDSFLEPGTTEEDLCIPTKDKGCLFNLSDDPYEANDLWNDSPDLIKHLTLRLRSIWAELKPRSPSIPDDRSNPAYLNYTWSPWLEDSEPESEPLTSPPAFPLKVSRGELQYVVDINLDAFKNKISAYIQNMGESFIQSVGGLFNFN